MKRYQAILLIFFALLLVACAAATPKIHLKSGDMNMEVTSKAPVVTGVAYSPDGKGAASGSFDGDMSLWDIEAGKLVKKIKMPTDHICKVVYSADGKTIVTGDGDGFIRFWDAKTGVQTKQFSSYSCFLGEGGEISLSTNDKSLLFKSSSNGNYALLDTQTGRVLRDFINQGMRVIRGGAISPDGRYVYIPPTLFDLRTGRTTMGATIQSLSSFSTFSLDGRYMLSSSVPTPPGSVYRLSKLDSMISLIEVSTGAEVRRFNLPLTLLTSVSFFPDNRYFISAGLSNPGKTGLRIDFQTWDSQTGAMIRQFSFRDLEINKYTEQPFPAFSPDNKFVILYFGSSLKLLDTSNGEELATFIGFEDGEWLVVTPDGYYNSSEKGAQYLSITVGEKKYDMSLFYDVFYRPDIVMARLRGEEIKDLVAITMQDAIKTPPPVVEINPVASTNEPKVKVCYKVKSTGGGIGEVRIFHNGKLVESDGYYKEVAKTSKKVQLAKLAGKAIYEEMRGIKIKGVNEISPILSKPKGEQFEGCKEVDAMPGENEVSVTAFNKDNTVQGYIQTVKFNSKVSPVEPNLYILSIGIDQYKDRSINLKYAVKDALDIKERLVKQAATLYKPVNIHPVSLTDKEATKEHIINKINELSAIIKPGDSFIFFDAGHGVLLRNQYQMITHGFDGTWNEDNMISSSEIVEISKKIKSLSQLFIFDTCHAGGVDYIVSGLYDARMSVMAKKMGLHIYASANSLQQAMDGYQGNGLFTNTLLKGLNNNRDADKDKDNTVSLVELGEYSRSATMEISGKIGHPQTPLIINFGKDNAVYRLGK